MHNPDEAYNKERASVPPRQDNEFFIKLSLNHFKIQRVEQDEKEEFHIYGECTSSATHCSNCHAKLTQIHAYADESSIEHLAIFDRKVWLHVKWPRFYCPHCDRTTQFRPEWLGKTGRMTKDLENFLLRHLVHADIKDVSLKFRTTEETLEGLLERYIQTDVDWNKYSLRVMGLDEISIRKGHGHYLTIISDLSEFGRTRVVTILRGHSEPDVLPFLRSIPQPKMAHLEAICVDMGTGYQSALKMWLLEKDFNQLVTIDRFHVARLLGSKIDKLRKQEIKKLKKLFKRSPDELDILSGTQWLFRKHVKDLSNEEYEQLQKLFQLSSKLQGLHKLKEDFFLIFETGYTVPNAKKKLKQWCRQAESMNYRELKTFVKTYGQHEKTILNYFKYRYSSGAVEGMNNKIRVITRRGFGYTNVEHILRRVLLDFNYASLFLPELSVI